MPHQHSSGCRDFTLGKFALGAAVAVSLCGDLAAATPEAAALESAVRHTPAQVFTREQAQALRRQFAPSFAAWSGGGDLSRYVHLHATEFWTHSVLAEGAQKRELAVADEPAFDDRLVSVAQGEVRLADYVRASPTDAAIIIRDGRILFEAYPRMRPRDRHLWFSVSKILVSTAVAVLEDRGAIDASQPIDRYLPALEQTAWSGTPVVDILDMASGIDCPEVKPEADSCFWRFYDAFGWPVADRARDDPMAMLPNMKRRGPPGEIFEYTSVNTELLNHLVEVVSGERFSAFIEREIWRPAGAESAGMIATTPNGAAFTGGGFSSSLRDMARFGMLFTDAVRAQEAPVISDAFMRKIQALGRPALTLANPTAWPRTALPDEGFRHNAYQWDIVTVEGHFYKSGFGGQGLYIAPNENLVIAWFGTQDERGENEMLSVARQLATSRTVAP